MKHTAWKQVAGGGGGVVGVVVVVGGGGGGEVGKILPKMAIR